ncbi:MAG: dihydroxy-acid dehydratase, partial [Candidatus Promineifilaceae bacterium]
ILTASGEKLGAVLDWWEQSERRAALKKLLRDSGNVDPDQVIMSADAARRAGLSSTVVFPTGNIAPEGSVIKATAIDTSVVDEKGVFHHRGPARVFVSESEAMKAVKGTAQEPIRQGDVIVLIGGGPSGTGMEETYQLTSALKFLPWGKTIPLLTDARFSGVSTGACVGHIGPEALAGGPIGKLRDGDMIEIVIDRNNLSGSINFVGTADQVLSTADAAALLAERPMHPNLQAHPHLPDDTRLWAALQRASGGVWRGCIYDVDKIIEVIDTGLSVTAE